MHEKAREVIKYPQFLDRKADVYNQLKFVWYSLNTKSEEDQYFLSTDFNKIRAKAFIKECMKIIGVKICDVEKIS